MFLAVQVGQTYFGTLYGSRKWSWHCLQVTRKVLSVMLQIKGKYSMISLDPYLRHAFRWVRFGYDSETYREDENKADEWHGLKV